MFAYCDCYEGEYLTDDKKTYICLECIRSMSDKLVRETKERFFDHQRWSRLRE